MASHSARTAHHHPVHRSAIEPGDRVEIAAFLGMVFTTAVILATMLLLLIIV